MTKINIAEITQKTLSNYIIVNDLLAHQSSKSIPQKSTSLAAEAGEIVYEAFRGLDMSQRRCYPNDGFQWIFSDFLCEKNVKILISRKQFLTFKKVITQTYKRGVDAMDTILISSMTEVSNGVTQNLAWGLSLLLKHREFQRNTIWKNKIFEDCKKVKSFDKDGSIKIFEEFEDVECILLKVIKEKIFQVS